jgi:hypothetical protein
MKPIEYVLSLLVALALLAALGVWAEAARPSTAATALACRSGQSAPVLLKGMSLYRCPGGKRG